MSQTRAFGTWELVGRDAELDALWTAYAGRNAAGALLTGFAGVGKSRIATEFLDRAKAAGRPVRRLAATRAFSQISFGAISPLLPSMNNWNPVTDEPRAYIESLAADGGLVLVIDDSYLLDEALAELVRELCSVDRIFIVMTTRTDRHLHEAISAVVDERLAIRMDIRPLSGEHVATLMTSVLDGAVHEATRQGLWETTLGNPLYLRELVLSGLEQGWVTERNGEWQWVGDTFGRDGLLGSIASRLSDVTNAERDVLETLAFVEPIGLTVLRTACSLESVAAADRRGLIRLETDDRRTNVRLAHTLYGDVLRPAISAERRRELLTRVADVIEDFGAHRREDAIRLSLWRARP